jgi:carbamate kinase
MIIDRPSSQFQSKTTAGGGGVGVRGRNYRQPKSSVAAVLDRSITAKRLARNGDIPRANQVSLKTKTFQPQFSNRGGSGSSADANVLVA